MSTGPQDYRDSQYLAGRANHYTYGDGADPVTGNALATEAVAHAINAQTAVLVTIAEILDHMAGGGPHVEMDAWRQVIPVARSGGVAREPEDTP
jgi:hypothetical protein